MGIDAPRALKQLRAEELRELCKEHGLSHVGKKGEMVERLVAFRGGEAAVADRLLAKSPKAKATASPQGRGGGRTKGRSAAVPMVKSSPSGGSQTTGPALSCGLLRKPNLLPSPVPGASLWAASRQQLLRCGRCQALYDLGNARYSASPESFWCPVCRFKVMDPFNSVVVPDGVLKHQLVTEPHFDFSLELPHLRQWRREGKAVEVRMLRVESTKVEQVWPRAIHFFANGVEVFAVHPPEDGHKRRDVPENISAGLKAGHNDIKVRMVDDDCVGFVLVVLLTSHESQEGLIKQVSTCETKVAQQRIQALHAKQAANTRSGDGEELVCLSSDTLKLQCPITMERVQDPVRGERCEHTQCFSLDAYLRSNRQMGAFNRRWLCPLCTLILRPQDLQRDSYVANILASTPDTVDEVVVMDDGSWRLKDGPIESEGRSPKDEGDRALDDASHSPAVCLSEEPVDLESPQVTPKTRQKTGSEGANEVRRLVLRGSKDGHTSRSGRDGRGRMRLSVNGSAPAIPASNEETPPEGFGLAVAVSMVGGAEQRLAQMELQDDDSPEKRKETPKRRAPTSRSLSDSAARSSSKRRKTVAGTAAAAFKAARAEAPIPTCREIEAPIDLD